MTLNTKPEDYIIDLLGKIPTEQEEGVTPSKNVRTALQSTHPDVKIKRFRQTVLEAIFEDGVEEQYGSPDLKDKLIYRVVRRFGKKRAKEILASRCEILNSWKYDSRFVPDAYIVDTDRKTVVCYEVEDHHPLNPFSIGGYADAWFTLEYIYWDLHLIAYDVYGNPRIVALPESEFIARHIRKKRNPPPA